MYKDNLVKVDHIFIFSNKGQEADDLVKFGLTEGSGRSHPGLGTRNRRFFFENFYLEILWVENESEAKSHSDIGIWERSNFENNGFSRFGLCLVNDVGTQQLFKDALKLQPDYYPQGKQLELFHNENKPYLPWIFQLPVISGKKRNLNEPTSYKSLGINKLTKTTFELHTTEIADDITNAIQNNSTIKFKVASTSFLILEFDGGKQQKTKRFEKIGLEIQY